MNSMSKSSNRTTMEVDVQTVGGSFDLEVNHGSGSFTQVIKLKLTKPLTIYFQVYTDLKNVVARISPKPRPSGPRSALLLNCHFDSVPQVGHTSSQ